MCQIEWGVIQCQDRILLLTTELDFDNDFDLDKSVLLRRDTRQARRRNPGIYTPEPFCIRISRNPDLRSVRRLTAAEKTVSSLHTLTDCRARVIPV